MIFRIFMFILGIVITSLSLMFIIEYYNLVIMGYSFIEYVNFISKKAECLLILFGILCIILSMIKRKEKNDIHI